MALAEKFIVEYTTKDIMIKLEQQDNKLEKIHRQTKATNGRVSKLENDLSVVKRRSIGDWIVHNVPKTIIFILAFFALVISDFRNPIIRGLITLIGGI